jgi:hypothetical protein
VTVVSVKNIPAIRGAQKGHLVWGRE